MAADPSPCGAAVKDGAQRHPKGSSLTAASTVEPWASMGRRRQSSAPARCPICRIKSLLSALCRASRCGTASTYPRIPWAVLHAAPLEDAAMLALKQSLPNSKSASGARHCSHDNAIDLPFVDCDHLRFLQAAIKIPPISSRPANAGNPAIMRLLDALVPRIPSTLLP